MPAFPVWSIIALITGLCVIGILSAADGSRRVGYEPDQFRLVRDKLANYDNKVKPTYDARKPVTVNFSMDLYQLLELNEPQQYVLLNAWIIERWFDEFLFWDPIDYNNISEIRLPHDAIWLPDTTLYNSLVMKDEDQRRLLNAKLVTRTDLNSTYIEMLYPAIFKFSCLLNLQYFPFDVQRCRMIFSSWTSDKEGIDYFPHNGYNFIGNSNFIENEGWGLLKTYVQRKEKNYVCCPVNYTLLHFDLYLRRKPLFYIVNLIIPTSIITLIAIVGFFTTSSASGMREEKVSLGITTLLSMSILMLMVSDQMPTTSTFIPLIGWFILGMIIVISLGTLASTLVIAVQRRGRMGVRLSRHSVHIIKVFSYMCFTDIPDHVKNSNEDSARLEAYRRSVKISNKLAEQGAQKKPWQYIKKNNSAHRRQNSNISERSGGPPKSPSTESVETGARMLSSNSTTQQSLLQSVGDGVRRPSDLPNMPPPAQAPLSTPVADDDLSDIGDLGDTENTEPTKNPVQREARVSQSALSKHLSVFSGNIKQNRKLAEEEYEWLATVLENCFFVAFVIIFLVVCIGINALGYYHWKEAEILVEQDINFIKIKADAE